jgi:hypothetical protein
LKTSTIVLIALGILAIYMISGPLSTLSNLNFIARGAAMNGGALQLTLGIQNPTSGAITLNSLVGNILVNGASFGNISNFASTIIAPNQETDIVLNIAPNDIGIAAGLLTSLEGGTDSLTVTAQATANINGAPVPVNLTFASLS